MRLDNRLSLVASFVRRSSRVADIGTDHARLPVWLVKNGVCRSAIATDIKAGPASIAIKNVAEAGLKSRISVRIGDGLQPIFPDEVDDIVIAGMGGETIAGIINSADWLKNSRYRLILQPMTKRDRLLKELLTAGFAIIDERIAKDGNKLYSVICSEYDPDAASAQIKRPAVLIKGGLDPCRDREYLIKQKSRLLKAAAGLEKSGKTDEAAKLLKLADEIFE